MLEDLWRSVSTSSLWRLITPANYQKISYGDHQLRDTIGNIKTFVGDVLTVHLASSPIYVRDVISTYAERRNSGIEHEQNEESDLAGTLMAAIGVATTTARNTETHTSLVAKWHYLDRLQVWPALLGSCCDQIFRLCAGNCGWGNFCENRWPNGTRLRAAECSVH